MSVHHLDFWLTVSEKQPHLFDQIWKAEDSKYLSTYLEKKSQLAAPQEQKTQLNCFKIVVLLSVMA